MAAPCTVRHSSVSEGLRLETGKRRCHDNENVSLFRNYSTQTPVTQRYSLANPSHISPGSIPSLCGSSVSLSVKDDTHSLDSLFLQRCSSESNFVRKGSGDADYKRSSNQSLKVAMQITMLCMK